MIDKNIIKAIEEHRRNHKGRKEYKKIVFDNPYSLDIEGGISSGGRGKGRLAVGIEENNLQAKFSAHEPNTNEMLTENINLKDIQTFKVSVDADETVQAEFKTFHGDWIRCPVSELRVSLDGMKSKEFNLLRKPLP